MFKPGDRVVRVILWNDYNDRYPIGTEATVVGVSEKYIEIKYDDQLNGHFPYHQKEDYVLESVYNSSLFRSLK